ncbi:hypothetical protein A6U87_07370 [Rhizobium sp. AC44/96]|uniref:hypothetical protein n=1 Tax=unclassified Rhizobium TaxID=2613769 RepID=UPI00080FD75E|nr:MULTISPECIES: hypothetical protein [unclassified Rhizobium]MDM9623017.1 hypothetical protein [Rhizobium sp. S96]OCJ13098.1 hypothetical protein A6U87_07370 [Rhizobium sp. AC44/96]
MGDTRGFARNGSKEAQRGLWRLLLKLPSIRGRLQIIAARSSHLNELFEAYEEANVALGRFQKERDRESCPLIEEYEALCAEIESDVLRLVLEDKDSL